MAIISPNPNKPQLINYIIAEENVMSEAFMGFMTYLIAKRFLQHDTFVVMDNAAIHSKGNVTILAIFLLTCSPELNPIELVFHILDFHVCSF
jgi:transposase